MVFFLVYFVSRSAMINYLILPVLLVDVNLEISISGSSIPSFESTHLCIPLLLGSGPKVNL